MNKVYYEEIFIVSNKRSKMWLLGLINFRNIKIHSRTWNAQINYIKRNNADFLNFRLAGSYACYIILNCLYA